MNYTLGISSTLVSCLICYWLFGFMGYEARFDYLAGWAGGSLFTYYRVWNETS